MSRFGLTALRSGFVMNASSQTISAAISGSTSGIGSGVEHEGAGQEIEAEVEAAAPMDRSCSSSSGSASPRPGSTSMNTSSGTVNPTARADLAGEPLGHEGTRTLARTMELDDVQPVVVGLDEARERAALAQRRDVARRSDVAGFRHRAGVYLWVTLRSGSNRASR